MLVVLGAGTALLGTAQVRSRPDVKGRLAASTTAQMGYLGLEAGLGLPAAVLAHLVGHGLWKATLFLGAGGAIERARLAGASSARRGTRGAIGSAAVAVLVLGAASWLPGPWGPALGQGPASAVPLLVAVAATATALHGLGRHSARARATAGALVVGAAAGYLLALRALSAAVDGELAPATPVWGAPGWVAALGVVGVLVAGATAAAFVDRAARRGRAPRLVSAVAASSAPPGRLRDAFEPWPAITVPEADAPSPSAVARARELVGVGSVLVAPSWPLDSFVASSPLASLEHLDLDDALRAASVSWGSLDGIPATMLRDALERGAVTEPAVQGVLRDSGLLAGDDVLVAGRRVPRLEVARALLLHDEPAAGAARGLLDGPDERIHGGVAGRAVAYLDALAARSYAATRWPAPAAGPFALLRSDRGLDRALRVRGARAFVTALPHEADAALAVLLDLLGARTDAAVSLLSHALVRSPGWAAHLAWRIRQGVDVPGVAEPELGAAQVAAFADLLAARLTVEVLVSRALAPSASAAAVRVVDVGRDPAGRVRSALGVDRSGRDDDGALADLVRRFDSLGASALRLAAWEESYRAPVLSAITAGAGGPGASVGPDRVPPVAQVVTCIDVRSERLRRHLEMIGPWETFGAAGFFGLPFVHVAPSGVVSELCPVVVRPTVTVTETSQARGSRWTTTDTLDGVHALEHGPFLPFALAEASGWLLGPWALARTIAPGAWHAFGRRVAARFGAPRHGVLTTARDAGGAGFDLDARTDLAESFLRSTGMVELASLVVLCGHGGTASNNPHVAAYDCGACGGHAGDVSARAMVQVLEDPSVRAGLARRGVPVPEATRFVAALHDTTRDVVTLLDAGLLPATAAPVVERLGRDLRAASDAVLLERLPHLPQAPAVTTAAAARRHVDRRASDWAQVRPEWGLAGNAAMVVGPRSMTRGLDLGGRVFLQSYRHDVDADGALLEALLTGPLVVAQWINMQYWCSTVDPRRWGAGDKTTHNVVVADGWHHALSGVFTGVRGDLRIGLPWQAVSAHAPDGDSWTGPTFHEPLRLLAVVAAPSSTVDAVLERHPRLARLALGGWITLTVVDPADGRLLRLDPGRGWVGSGERDGVPEPVLVS